MATHPYIHFQGQAAEALAAYGLIFGGTDLQIMRYADAPGLPDEMKSDRVIHGQITLGDGTLMASDFPAGMEGDPQQAVSIMQSAPDVSTARTWFEALAEGGAVVQAFGPSFFSPGSAW